MPKKEDEAVVVNTAAKTPEHHGPCKDCGEPVDVLVEIHQCAGKNQVLCVECRCERIMRKARETVGGIKEDAEQAREDARQQVLPGME